MTGSGFIHCRDHYWSFSHPLWNYKFKMSTFLLSDTMLTDNKDMGHCQLFLIQTHKRFRRSQKCQQSFFFFFFPLFFLLQKQSFAFRCYSMCRRIKGIPAVFKQIPVSRFKCTNLWEPNSFISEMFFLSFLVHCRQNEDVSANQECIQIIFLHQGNPSKLLSFRGPTGILESLLPV